MKTAFIGLDWLMTDNPLKYERLADFGLGIVEQIPLVAAAHRENAGYLATKQHLFGQLLQIDARHPASGSREFPCSPAHATA